MQTYTHTDHKRTHQHHLTVLTPDKKTNCPLVICCSGNSLPCRFTSGYQKVRSLIQLTTKYEHDILSPFNIVPFNRNALRPVILQSPYSTVQEFLIMVLQPVTRDADNIFIFSKFSSFHEFLQFWKQIEVTADQIWRIRWVAEQFNTCVSDGSQCL